MSESVVRDPRPCPNRIIVEGDRRSVADLTHRLRSTHVVYWGAMRSSLVHAEGYGEPCEADVRLPDVPDVDFDSGRFVMGAILPVPADVARMGRASGRIWKMANWGADGLIGDATIEAIATGPSSARAVFRLVTTNGPPTGVVGRLAAAMPWLRLSHLWSTAEGISGGNVWKDGRRVISVTSPFLGSIDPQDVLDMMEDRLHARMR